MAQKHYRFVNPIPAPKTKREVLNDSETSVLCKICRKSFVTEMALENHVRMEHIDIYLTGDKNKWKELKCESLAQSREEIVHKKSMTKVKTDKLLSPMTRTRLMSLASEDVSYIIIKSKNQREDSSDEIIKKRKVSKEKHDAKKKDEEVQLITGPFECLQPSNLLADGICHQMFFSCCEYSVHHRDEHTRRRKGIRCQVCEQPLSPQPVDKEHPHTCLVCNAGFATTLELAEHTNTAHVKVKPFKCDICQKRFTQQAGVHQHMRMHNGDRPFACTFCEKTFTQKSGLDQHLRIHTKVKPYKCVVCGKAFCQSIHLKQHMRTHTNVTPFQCVLCQKRFKQSSHLNYHLKGHNPATLDEEQRLKYIQCMGIVAKELEPNMSEEERAKLESMSLEVVEIELPPDPQYVEQTIDKEQCIVEEQTEEMWNTVEETDQICVLMDPGDPNNC